MPTPPLYYVPTDWGAVEQDVIAWIKTHILTDARAVKSALSEDDADDFAKGVNSIFTISRGCDISETGEGGGGYITLDEVWTLDVVIYSASGKAQDVDRWAIQTLSARVKGILTGYSPGGQVDNNGWLRITRDEPVVAFQRTASSGLKVRQTYELASTLHARITGSAAA